MFANNSQVDVIVLQLYSNKISIIFFCNIFSPDSVVMLKVNGMNNALIAHLTSFVLAPLHSFSKERFDFDSLIGRKGARNDFHLAR